MAPRRPEGRRAGWVVLTALALVGGAVSGLRALAPKPPAGPSLRVPRVATAPKLDGEADDWRGVRAETGRFQSVDGQSTPDSEARLAWRDGKLYLLLYAADQDIRASVTTHDAPLWPEDAFKLEFRRPGEASSWVIYVSPRGTVTDEVVNGQHVDLAWQSGAEVAHDIDGTPNDAHDEDEEWVIELALPLGAVGLAGVPGERIGFSVRRCDVPKGAGRRCAAWGEPDGVLELE